MIHNCIEAIKIMKKKFKLHVGLINVHSLKPLHLNSLKRKIKKTKNLLVVEDHTFYGGLYSIINNIVRKLNSKINLNYIAINDDFVDSGKPTELEKKYGFEPNDIAKKFNEIYTISKQRY